MTNEDKKIKKNDSTFFLLTKKAIPEVLLDVLKVKDLIEQKNISVVNATKEVGISRTTYYKYCNEVFYYDEVPSSKTINIEILMIDKVGGLSKITNTISKNNFNILTIKQNEPINKLSKINISIESTDNKCSLTNLVDELNSIENIQEVKITSIEKGNNEI